MLKLRNFLSVFIIIITSFLLFPLLSPLICAEDIKKEEAPQSVQPAEEAPEPAPGTEQKVKAPKILIDAATHDFGEMRQQSKAEHIFKISNTGDGDLEIKNIKTSCGCTAAMISSNLIHPGETGELKVIFSSKRFQGVVTRQITFRTNDPVNDTVTLKIKALVTAILETSPNYLSFGRVVEGKSVERILKLKNMTNEVMTIETITPEDKNITVDKFEKDINPSYETSVKLTYTAPKSLEKPSSSAFGNIAIQIKDKEKIAVPFSAQLVGEIQLRPKNISFNVVNAGQTPQKDLKIENRGQKELKILSIKYDSNILETEFKAPASIKPGETLKIPISLSSKLPEGSFKGEIEFQTDNPKHPVLSAPIFGVVKKAKQQESPAK